MLAGIMLFGVYLYIVGLLPWDSARARHMRAMKNRTAAPAAATTVTADSIAALPRGAPFPSYVALEQRAVVLDGYVQRMVRAPDDDIHLEVVAQKRLPGEGNITYVTGEITPQWRRGNRWTYDALVQAFHPSIGGVTSWDGGTRRVRLTGWLLYDYEHEGAPPMGPPRVSSWELHPVTGIEVWNDTLATWRALPGL